MVPPEAARKDECNGNMPAQEPGKKVERHLALVRDTDHSQEKELPISYEDDMTARREAVLCALREHGTMNTDFLGINKQIGTHTERPQAFMGESIITENKRSFSVASTIRVSTPEELASLDAWVRNFPHSLRESTKKAYEDLRQQTAKKEL